MLADIRLLKGEQFQGADLLWASPPCEEFSRWRMPWTRRRAREPDLSLVRAAFRVRDEARPRFFILENVREAQRWLGPALIQRAGRYLWGDALLAPLVTARPKESYSSTRPDLRSEVPFDLSYGIAKALGNAVVPQCVAEAVRRMEPSATRERRGG